MFNACKTECNGQLSELHDLFLRKTNKTCKINSVAHVPDLKYRSMSVTAMIDAGYQVVFVTTRFYLQKNSGWFLKVFTSKVSTICTRSSNSLSFSMKNIFQIHIHCMLAKLIWVLHVSSTWLAKCCSKSKCCFVSNLTSFGYSIVGKSLHALLCKRKEPLEESIWPFATGRLRSGAYVISKRPQLLINIRLFLAQIFLFPITEN